MISDTLGTETFQLENFYFEIFYSRESFRVFANIIKLIKTLKIEMINKCDKKRMEQKI